MTFFIVYKYEIDELDNDPSMKEEDDNKGD